MLSVQIVYALPDRVWQQTLVVPEGSVLADAVQASNMLEACPETGDWATRVGIHGRRVAPETKLRDQDRIEIYRPLLIDPKDARRQRASRLRHKRA
ncbi:RnfH family protein [Ahniella affigens]|uniref:UPF0125 protein C7S18_01770 n=1 Tax=Ahniella affigens TaxID=2021234 RepID=A0A2P1PMD1_9GAMM|nr:RnfH family protein [Ahniella affigens]AVP95995.1 RnfH family protein [Ahniella affigens]